MLNVTVILAKLVVVLNKEVFGSSGMKIIIGYCLLILTIVALILVYVYILKKKVYAKDIIGLLIDSWEVLGLAIALILVLLILILK
jgi:hypothetical protein